VNEDCKRDFSIHARCHDDHKKCIRLDLLEKILDEAVDSYLIVNTREDIKKVKVPYYTDILILGDRHSLWDHYGEALRELVYSGKGLISSLYLKHEGCHNEKDEFLYGVEYRGHLPGHKHLVHFLQSTISDEMIMEARDEAIRVDVDDSNRIVAWMDESKEHQCHHKPKKYPGVVLNQYGLGKTAFFAFDLGLTLNDENCDQVLTILENAITHVHKPLNNTVAFYPYQMIPIEIEVRSVGGAMDVRVQEMYPPEIKLYDPMRGDWITDSPWMMDIHLEPNEIRTIFFYALAPDRAGVYTLQTEAGFLENGIYHFHESFSIEIVVEKDSAKMVDDIIEALKSLAVSKKDRSRLNDAIEHMERVQKRVVVTAKDVKKNIHDILQSIDSLLSITSTDISAIRLMMDRLFEIWLGRYYQLKVP
jgi:type 1 glutamine amidotransferase